MGSPGISSISSSIPLNKTSQAIGWMGKHKVTIGTYLLAGSLAITAIVLATVFTGGLALALGASLGLVALALFAANTGTLVNDYQEKKAKDDQEKEKKELGQEMVTFSFKECLPNNDPLINMTKRKQTQTTEERTLEVKTPSSKYQLDPIFGTAFRRPEETLYGMPGTIESPEVESKSEESAIQKRDLSISGLEREHILQLTPPKIQLEFPLDSASEISVQAKNDEDAIPDENLDLSSDGLFADGSINIPVQLPPPEVQLESQLVPSPIKKDNDAYSDLWERLPLEGGVYGSILVKDKRIPFCIPPLSEHPKSQNLFERLSPFFLAWYCSEKQNLSQSDI